MNPGNQASKMASGANSRRKLELSWEISGVDQPLFPKEVFLCLNHNTIYKEAVIDE